MTHKALADAGRFRILEELRAAGPLDAHELGRRVGLHPNTVRSHVDQLERARLVRSLTAPPAGRGRPRVLYEASAEPPPGPDTGYRLLAQVLASYLSSADDPAGMAESAGRAWGSYLAEKPAPFAAVSPEEATRKVIDLFDELGFLPEAAGDAERPRILLHRCPFRQVAESNPEVACSVHLGMLRGALEELGAPLEATTLEPFVEPSLCVAHLARRRGPRHGRARPGASAISPENHRVK